MGRAETDRGCLGWYWLAWVCFLFFWGGAAQRSWGRSWWMVGDTPERSVCVRGAGRGRRSVVWIRQIDQHEKRRAAEHLAHSVRGENQPHQHQHQHQQLRRLLRLHGWATLCQLAFPLEVAVKANKKTKDSWLWHVLVVFLLIWQSQTSALSTIISSVQHFHHHLHTRVGEQRHNSKCKVCYKQAMSVEDIWDSECTSWKLNVEPARAKQLSNNKSLTHRVIQLRATWLAG